jgi:hypothetical protein
MNTSSSNSSSSHDKDESHSRGEANLVRSNSHQNEKIQSLQNKTSVELKMAKSLLNLKIEELKACSGRKRGSRNSKIRQLKTQIQNNKTFLYMVIHDLKHPTEAALIQLGLLKDETTLQRNLIRKQENLI